MEPCGTDFKIVDYAWDANMPEETKRKLRQLWSPFVGWKGTEQADAKSFTYLTAVDILKCVTATLDRFDSFSFLAVSLGVSDLPLFQKPRVPCPLAYHRATKAPE